MNEAQAPTPANCDLLREMAENWFGYGNWNAPYWFLGPEHGGDDVQGPARAWVKLGRGELLDCKAHHLEFGFTRWHSPLFPLQPTWRRLMLLLHAFLGEDTSNDNLRAYQAVLWGAEHGETCVIELSSNAARSLRHEQPLRLHDVEARIATLKSRIAEYRPKFVLMYSIGDVYLEAWPRIAPFNGSDSCRTGDTIAMITPSPAAHGYFDTDWVGFAKKLRKRCIDEGLIR